VGGNGAQGKKKGRTGVFGRKTVELWVGGVVSEKKRVSRRSSQRDGSFGAKKKVSSFRTLVGSRESSGAAVFKGSAGFGMGPGVRKP